MRPSTSWIGFVLLCAVRGQAQTPATTGYSAIGRFESDLAGTRLTTAADTPITEKFRRAVQDAARSDPARISHGLVPVRPDNDGLIWKGDGPERRVLATVMTSFHGYDSLVHTKTTVTREVWVTMGQELREFCAASNIPREGMVLRLEQLIGLDPSGRDRLVEMWVRPQDMFRPAPDPEITDREAELDFPQAGSSLRISEDHVKWINDLKAISYGPTGFPWTRLGYTYDWGNANSILGLSEFLVRNGSEVEIESVNDPADYCLGQRRNGIQLSARDVVNLASGLGGGVAPGEWLAVSGLRLSETGSAPPAIVTFDGIAAKVSAYSPSRLHVLAPESLKGRFRTELVVERGTGEKAWLMLPVLSSAPGVFTVDGSGRGTIDALNEDGTRNSEDRPAVRGTIVTFWVTGMNGSSLLSVRVGGTWVPVDDTWHVGEVEPGIHLVQIRIPRDLPEGDTQSVVVTAGRGQSRTDALLYVK